MAGRRVLRSVNLDVRPSLGDEAESGEAFERKGRSLPRSGKFRVGSLSHEVVAPREVPREQLVEYAATVRLPEARDHSRRSHRCRTIRWRRAALQPDENNRGGEGGGCPCGQTRRLARVCACGATYSATRVIELGTEEGAINASV